MNRLKLWLYMLVFLGAGAANLWVTSQDQAARALGEADARLQTGVLAFKSGERLLELRASAVTALAAQDPALLEALAARAPEADRKKAKAAAPTAEEDAAAEAERQAAAEGAAKAAVEKAAARLGIDLPPSSTWAVANPEGLAKLRINRDGSQREVAAFLGQAAGGSARRGYARVNDSLWYGVALPAGRGSALVLFLPLDAAWVAQVKAASGCDVTLDAGTPQLVTTAPADRALPLVAAATAKSAGGRAVGVGSAPPVALHKALPVKVPLLFVQAPAERAVALALADLPKGSLVLSVSSTGSFAALGTHQWLSVAALAGLLLLGLLLGLIMKTEGAPQVPEPLLAAASRIERGDFTARAPVLAGKFGTLGTALNRAAEVAQLSHAARVEDPFGARGPEPEPVFELPPRPAAPPPPAPFEPLPAPMPYRSAPGPAEAVEATGRLDGPAAPARTDTAFASESFAPRPVPRTATVQVTAMGMTAVGVSAVGGPASPGPEEDEETHWRAIHAEFLRVRGECGESVEGLGFERFRPKLEKNRDALIAKYGCRRVRFQVYVKDGKAALKATPVR